MFMHVRDSAWYLKVRSKNTCLQPDVLDRRALVTADVVRSLEIFGRTKLKSIGLRSVPLCDLCAFVVSVFRSNSTTETRRIFTETQRTTFFRQTPTGSWCAGLCVSAKADKQLEFTLKKGTSTTWRE